MLVAEDAAAIARYLATRSAAVTAPTIIRTTAIDGGVVITAQIVGEPFRLRPFLTYLADNNGGTLVSVNFSAVSARSISIISFAENGANP
jgi:hypothetical protein